MACFSRIKEGSLPVAVGVVRVATALFDKIADQGEPTFLGRVEERILVVDVDRVGLDLER
jgi:hypothetical protein